MTKPQKCIKSDSEKHNKQKKSKKRKNISPLQKSEKSEQKSGSKVDTKVDTKLLSGQLLSEQWNSTVSPEPNEQCHNKRFHPSSPEYFNFVPYAVYSNNLNTMAMNFPSMPAFGSGFMQSQPFNSTQFQTQNPAQNSGPSTCPPPWATQIMEDLKSIKISVSKIESIEKTVNHISSKVETLESKMKTMETKVQECEKSSTFINGEFEKTKEKLKSASDDVKRLNTKCKDFETVVKTLETKNKSLEDKTNDLEFRSMRENLLFHGIEEGTNENCELLVKRFIAEQLEIGEDIKLDRAHRLGKPKGRTRPIVVKFHEYRQRELIRVTAGDKYEALKTVNKGVGVQQTRAVLQKRREMNEIYDREKAAGRQVKWSGAKLLVRDGGSGNFREVTE